MAFNLYDTLSNDLAIDEASRTVAVIPQLKDKDYAQVKNVFTRLGGVWKSANSHFAFSKSPSALIERVLSVGTRQLNQFHFYPTPDNLFDFIKEHTPLSFLGASGRSLKVIEPSCGEGGMIKNLLKFGEEEGRSFDVVGYDIDPLNVMFCQEAGLDVVQADFLTVTPNPTFDLVLMNPAFNRDEFIKHIKHAQKFLNRQGLLISVVPTAWIADFAKTPDRTWLLEQSQINSSVELQKDSFFPPNTFKGVSIPTTIICLESIEKANEIINGARYLSSAIDSFHLYLDNHNSDLHRYKSIKNSGGGRDEIKTAIESLVTEILSRKDDESIHLVRRFSNQFQLSLLGEPIAPDISNARGQLNLFDLELIAA